MPKKIRFLIAYGPTREPIDPVRYISNYSTGTMGRYLVEAAKKSGHAVTAVESPKDAETALDLLNRLKKLLPKHDVLIMNSAVCDMRPEAYSKSKIKKNQLNTLKLVQNPDILATLSHSRKAGQFFIGFGLESEDLAGSGHWKLLQKNLEMIVLQEVTSKLSPFGEADVKAIMVYRSGQVKKLGNISKKMLAKRVISEVLNLYSI